MTRIRTGSHALLATISAIAFTAPLAAQQTSPAETQDSAASASDANQVGDIIVTASKRETTLLRTPVAVTALGQASLDAKGILSVRDLKGNVPNLQIGTGADSGSAIALRGVVSTDTTEVAESAVALHLDGVYMPRSQSALSLMYDVDRVEVLRGPQGTLFGMNSPGGAINIIPSKPEFGEWSGKAEVAMGNYNSRELRGVINLGLTDRFAIRISGMYNRHDGYLDLQEQDFTDLAYPSSGIVKDGIPDVDQRRNRKVRPKDWYNNANEYGVRAIARWQPVDGWEITGTAQHYVDIGAGDIDFVDCNQAAGTVNACDHPLRYAKVNVPGSKRMVIDDFLVKVTGDLTDTISIEYRGGYQDERRRQITDLDGGAHPATQWSSIGAPATPEAALTQYYPVWDETTITNYSRYRSLTNELQIKSRGSGPLQYVFGAFVLHENKRIRYDDEIAESKTYNDTGDPASPDNFYIDGLPNTFVYNQAKRTTTSRALFGQVDWRVIPKIGLTAGYRYSWDKKADIGGVTYGYDGSVGDQIGWYNGLYTPPFANGPPGVRAHQSNNLSSNMGSGVPLGVALPAVGPPSNERRQWRNGSLHLGAQYYADAATMLYASVSTGYKMGGFYEQFDTCNHGCLELLQYDPEKVISYEVGYKGKLFDNHLQLSLTAFLTNYRNMQQTGEEVVGIDQAPDSNTFGRPISTYTTVNLTNAQIKGIEAEFTATPWRGGTLSGFATYLHARVTKSGLYVDGYARAERAIYGQTDFDADGTTSLLGKTLPYAPAFSASLNYRHDIDVAGGYRLSPYASVRYQTKMWLDILNYSGAHLAQYQVAYAKIDANMRLTAPNDRFFVEVFGENLTDVATKSFDNQAYGRVRAYFDAPRTWGIRAGTKF
jgi:iron complex outermembrane receptor protein